MNDIVDKETGEVLNYKREELKEQAEEMVDVSTAEDIIEKGYKDVEYKPIGMVRILKPTIEDEQIADIAYAEELTRLMIETKLPTVEEMEKQLKKRGGDNEWDEEHLEEMRDDLTAAHADILLYKEVYKTDTSKTILNKLTEAKKKYAKMKKEFIRLNSIRQKYLSATIEGRADQKRLIAKMSRCIYNLQGKRIWETISQLEKEPETPALGALVYDFIAYINGLDPRVLSSVPSDE